MRIKGKFEGQLDVGLQFSPRDQVYRVIVSEWRKTHRDPDGDWYVPTLHYVYDDCKGFENERSFSARRRTRALRYYAKAKAEQAYRHAQNAESKAAEGTWELIAR